MHLIAIRRALALSVSLGIVTLAAAEPRSATSLLPKGAVATVVIRDGAGHVRAMNDWLDSREFFESATWKRIEQNPGFMQARVGALGLAAAAGLDPLSAMEVIVGHEAALGVYPGSGAGPRLLLAVTVSKSAEFDRLMNSIHGLVGLGKDAAGDESRVREIDGVRVYSLGPQESHCRFDDWFLIANDRDLLRSALELRKGPERSLAGDEAFRRSEASLPAGICAWAVADLETLRAKLPGAAKLMDPADNPLGGFLFDGWRQALAQGDQAVLWLSAGKNELSLSGRITSKDEFNQRSKGLAPRELVRQSWPAGELPRFLAELTVTRGWASLFADRETLLKLPAAGDLVNFNTTLSSLLGGMDFMNDVLPRVAGPTRLILANQDFSASRLLPTPQLPAFALVTPLKMEEGSEFARRLYSGAQTVVSVLNVDNAQQKRPTYLVDTEKYRDQRLLTAAYPESDADTGMDMDAPPREMKADPSAPPKADDPAKVGASQPGKRRVPIRYNFAPAVAVVKDHFVIATSLPLLKDVIDRILDARAAAGGGAGANAALDALSIRADALATILRANRSELVTQRMLEQDLPKARAEGDIDTVLELLGLTSGLNLRTFVEDKVYRAELTLGFKPAK